MRAFLVPMSVVVVAGLFALGTGFLIGGRYIVTPISQESPGYVVIVDRFTGRAMYCVPDQDCAMMEAPRRGAHK